MFDVSWSDASRETVGQRRDRKELDQITLTPGIQRRPSTSSEVSKTKHRPSVLNLLHGNRKDFSRPQSRANVSKQRKEVAPEPVPSRAARVGDAASAIRELSLATLTSDKLQDRFIVTELPDPRDSKDNYSPSNEPAFASWASRSPSSESTWSSMADSPRKNNFVQPLSPTSFVTQRTEITVASCEDIKENEQNATFVHISASKKGLSVRRELPPQISPSSSTSDFHVPELYPAEKNAGFPWFEEAMPRSPGRSMMGDAAEKKRWTPPENWECPSSPVPPPKSSARPPWRPESHEKSLPGVNAFQLQKTIKRMRTASSKIMLERLREEWTHPTDEPVDEGFEFERQLWMCTALSACVERCKEEEKSIHDGGKMQNSGSMSPRAVKILSLHQDRASLALLSTSHSSSSIPPLPPTEIHHLSTSASISSSAANTPLPLPLPTPPIHPLTVPSPNPLLPYGPAVFATIHASLALPALLPGPALPQLLRECHRVLRAGAALHVLLIDPCPPVACTGPRLRAWLDAHLLLGLERRFRCVSPCRLVPGWLVDAGFAIGGSVGGGGGGDTGAGARDGVARMRFAAAGETALVMAYEGSGGRWADWAGEETREELKGVVGRGLWEECWGAFCVDGSRWWDDGLVMEECVKLGTAWEILIVEARKEG